MMTWAPCPHGVRTRGKKTPSEVPEPTSQNQKNAKDPPASAFPVETMVSASDEAATKERRPSATPASPGTNETDRTQEQRQPTEGEQAGETESDATDEVIDLDDSTEAIPVQTASSSQDAKLLVPAPSDQPTPRHLSPGKAAASRQQAGKKRPAPTPPLGEAEDQENPSESPSSTTNTDVGGEGGHPCGRPLVPPSKDTAVKTTVNPCLEEAKRRSRWASSPPAVSAALPQGVDPESQSAASSSQTRPPCGYDKGVMVAPTPPVTARPKMQGPVAVKSKAVKPTVHPQERASEQGMIDAIQSRLHTPPPPDAGLMSIAAARPTATAATNPQMPVIATDDTGVHTSTKEEAPTTEIFLEEADDQSGPVDADITHLAEQRAMHTVLRYQTLAVKYINKTSSASTEVPTTLPPVAPPVSLYANLPQEWPLACLSVQLRHIGVLLRVTLCRRVAELNFRGVDFRRLPREVMRSITYDFNNIHWWRVSQAACVTLRVPQTRLER